MEFKWLDVNEVLPEDVMEHKEIANAEIVPKRTDDVLIRFKNKRKSNKIQVLMAHRAYCRINSIPNGGKENYKPIGWKWYNEWYSPCDSFNIDKDAEITHWAYIPKVN